MNRQLSPEKELKLIYLQRAIDKIEDKETLSRLLKELVEAFLMYEETVKVVIGEKCKGEIASLSDNKWNFT